jgi:penicillin-binding protein 2
MPFIGHLFLKNNLTIKTYAKFQEMLFDFQGFYVDVRTDRKYKYSNAAHIMGYIGEVTEKMIENFGWLLPNGRFYRY